MDMRDRKPVRTVAALVLPVAAAVLAVCTAGSHAAHDALFALLKLVVIR